jgi:hypothetical protein
MKIYIVVVMSFILQDGCHLLNTTERKKNQQQKQRGFLSDIQ